MTNPPIREVSVLVRADTSWRKSSYSDGAGNNCVEIADLTVQVGIRDSKNVAGPKLVVPTSAWSSFVGMITTD
ncbi:DUF397 domain-containing protein [Streptomyces sp. NPDC096310]|uniref:DUF397 domain-containing protein n=1 Tax=Streptomyces sp. NPDC096310 TaxID=3366082 RepID=UPI00380FA424